VKIIISRLAFSCRSEGLGELFGVSEELETVLLTPGEWFSVSTECKISPILPGSKVVSSLTLATDSISPSTGIGSTFFAGVPPNNQTKTKHVPITIATPFSVIAHPSTKASARGVFRAVAQSACPPGRR
jgi:hypothetical protein